MLVCGRGCGRLVEVSVGSLEFAYVGEGWYLSVCGGGLCWLVMVCLIGAMVIVVLRW